MQEEIIRLKEAHAFLERTVEMLNEAILMQQKDIDHLSLRVRELEERVAGGEDMPPAERPPHY